MFAAIDDESQKVAMGHPALLGAGEIMVSIAREFCAGKLQKAELYKKRDELLKAQG